MSDQNQQPYSEEFMQLLKAVIELQSNGRILAEAVKKMEQASEGTVERKGMKERLTVAEYNIEEHKKAWVKNSQELKDMEERLNRAFVQIVAEFKTSITGRLDALSASLDKEKTWITKIKPYMDVLMWVIGLVAAYLLTQFLSGNIQIVRTP